MSGYKNSKLILNFKWENFGISDISVNHDDGWQISKVSADWYGDYYVVDGMIRREVSSIIDLWSSMIFETEREINILGSVCRKTTSNLHIITYKKNHFFLYKEEESMAKLLGWISYKLGTYFWVKTLEHSLGMSKWFVLT